MKKKKECSLADLKEVKYGSATAKELWETMNRLAHDPIARKKVEEEVRKKLGKNESFYMDDMGIGHFFSALYISKPNRKGKFYHA